jgi:hypothetical protein
MWSELGLKETTAKAPPQLAHERWAAHIEGWPLTVDSLVQSVRQADDFDNLHSLLLASSLDTSIDVQRLAKLSAQEQETSEEIAYLKLGAISHNLSLSKKALKSALYFAANHEIHLRKTFWVDEALAFMLSQTNFDAHAADLQLPFTAFAFVFTDRKFLSLAERMLSTDRDEQGAKAGLAGFILKAATVYVTQKEAAANKVIEIGMAFDTLGADLPDIVEHTLVVIGAAVEGLPKEDKIQIFNLDDEALEIPQISPKGQLLQMILNAIMYSTSAGIEIVEIGATKNSNGLKSPRNSNTHLMNPW